MVINGVEALGLLKNQSVSEIASFAALALEQHKTRCELNEEDIKRIEAGQTLVKFINYQCLSIMGAKFLQSLSEEDQRQIHQALCNTFFIQRIREGELGFEEVKQKIEYEFKILILGFGLTYDLKHINRYLGCLIALRKERVSKKVIENITNCQDFFKEIGFRALSPR